MNEKIVLALSCLGIMDPWIPLLLNVIMMLSVQCGIWLRVIPFCIRNPSRKSKSEGFPYCHFLAKSKGLPPCVTQRKWESEGPQHLQRTNLRGLSTECDIPRGLTPKKHKGFKCQRGEHLEVKFQRVWNFKTSCLGGGYGKKRNDLKAPFNLLVNLLHHPSAHW